MYAVKKGEAIRGNMTRLETGDWVTTDEVLRGDQTLVSSITSKPENALRFACLTMGGIRIYSCGAFPSDGRLNFYDVQVKDQIGSTLSMPGLWNSTVTHSECGQNVEIERESGIVSILYSNTPQARSA